MKSSGKTRAHANPPRGDGGYVLVMALLILAVLFVAASSFMRLTLSEDQIATSDRDMILALNAAEAGVQQAYQNIKAAAILTGLLRSPAQNTGDYIFGEFPRAAPCLPGSAAPCYTFTIANDPAESASADPTVDGNSHVKIISTGRVRNATRIIETVVCVPKLPPFPGALNVPGREGDARIEDTRFVFDGHDTDPTNGTPTGAVTKLGVSAYSATERNNINIPLSDPERMQPVFDGSLGDADVPGMPVDRRFSLGVDTSLDSNAAQNLVGMCGGLADARNTRDIARGNLSVSGTHTYANARSGGYQGGPNAPPGNNQAWGTPERPGVFYIKGITPADYDADPNPPANIPPSGVVSFSGNFEGAGILIVEGADLSIDGNFRWEGVIIVTGPLVATKFGGSGTKVVFGAMAVNEIRTDRCTARSDCNELILEGSGTTAVRYSQTAINLAGLALKLRPTYWNERGL